MLNGMRSPHDASYDDGSGINGCLE